MRFFGVAILWAVLVATIGVRARASEPTSVDFARDVRPILVSACGKCHGADKQQGSLRFDRRDGAVRAGDSRSEAIVPGKPDESEMILRIESADADVRMPPKSAALDREKIKTLRAWIEQGAKWPADGDAPAVRKELTITADDRQHWSYRPFAAVALPEVADRAWSRTEIDRFIAAALEVKRLRPNDLADRRTLLRRAYFDVVGLPPAMDEVASFLADGSPDAYERLVDRLLSSPHYGERWGRHWLDVARYADSDGLETDADRPNAHPYRDFVIRALNEDLPYETFVRWQLAGDEYERDNPLAVAATGFLTAGPSMVLNVPMEEEKLRLRFNELDDIAGTTASALLGLTLACARCHDHKFDAIPTRDYYRIQCAFTGTRRTNAPLASPEAIARHTEQTAAWKRRLDGRRADLNAWLADQRKPHTASLYQERVKKLSISADEKTILLAQPQSEAAKQLAKRHEKALRIADEDYRRVFRDDQRQRWDEWKREIAELERTGPAPLPTALAITEPSRTPEPTWLLDRGDFHSRKSPLRLGFLTVLTGTRSPEDYLAQAKAASQSASTSLQRRALADWITDTNEGGGRLLARVAVNRIWQHHFGEGLVRTVSDFGVRGERPTHPQLLEFIANDFVASGTQVKRLHRRLLTSAVYMQATTFDAARSVVDPDNRLLWRRRPMRLESEILRDAMLSVSDELNLRLFGPAFKPPIPAEAIVARNERDPYPKDARDTPETRRRSVYLFHKRVAQHPLMQAFDGPDASVSCGRRASTTVAPQALALLNDPFVRDRANAFAARLLAGDNAGDSSPDEWIERGFQLALARRPTDTERAASIGFIESQIERHTARNPSASTEAARRSAVADFCQALFSLNEFIYVD